MAKRIETIANHQMLVWARTTLGLDVPTAAKKSKVPEANLTEWEAGTARPNLTELSRLAEAYRRPLAIFFMSTPPADIRPPKDFRHLHAAARGVLSPELRLALRRAELRQELAADLLKDEVREIRKLIGSVTLPANAAAVAASVRASVGIDIETQASWNTPNEALNNWINAFEALGILIFQVMGVSVSEMRGLSIHDDIVPAILLNTGDGVRPRIFTLAHELGHLVLGAEGLCDIADPDATGDRVETFCNIFASAFLVPGDALVAHEVVQAKAAGDLEWDGAELADLTATFGVSAEVILRRLVAVGKTTNAHYKTWRAAALKRPAPKKEKSVGGPDYYTMLIVRHGSLFTQLVLGAYHDQVITGADVSEYLETKVSFLPKIEKALARRIAKVGQGR
jgi:Zn-dependent peptidase ImmA (M78 family)/transcriptional regulator with XRE-family HTH domain